MPDLEGNELKALHARLAELGPDAVRTLVATGGLPQAHTVLIMKWLADQAKGAKEK